MQKPVILVVDDFEIVRFATRTTLELAGYKVIQAIHGKDALQQFSRETVDLVITDLNMPEMNGVELTKAIRQDTNHKNVPIVMLTTEDNLEKQQDAKAAGISGWIQKPYTNDRLLKVVKRFVH